MPLPGGFIEIPAGLKSDRRKLGLVNTWDMGGDDIMNMMMARMDPQAHLEIKGDSNAQYIVPITPIDRIQKATVTTADAGAYNAIFGAAATIQVAQDMSAFGALPKMGYPREGFRVAYAAAIASGAGVAQAAAMGTAVEPTYMEVTISIKEVEVVTELSTRLEVISTKNDTITFEGNAGVVFSNFMEAIDTDLLQDCDTLAGDNIESLDRITSSTALITGKSYTAGDEDYGGIDRSTPYAWWDGNADHGSATDRSMTKPLVDALMRDQKPYWGRDWGNKLYLSPDDSWIEFSSIEAARQRMGETTVQPSINGIKTWRGGAGGFKLATYDTIEWLQDSNVQADTIGRLYLFDLNHLGMVIARPIDFIDSADPFVVGHVHRGAWYGILETWCDLPKGQGQLCDLKTN